MPLVIYLGLHAITREPALLLPSEQKQITLATLKVNDTAALRDKPDSGQQKGKHVAKNNPPVLFLESLSEDATGTIKQWLQQETTQHITLVWLQPVPYIAAKLAEGEDTESTLQAWQQMANATLNLFRQHRRQITLIGADIGGAPPQHDKASLLTLPPAKHAPIFTLAASQLLAASSAMQENADHLSASSIAVYPQTEEVVDQVINTLRDHQKTSQQNNDLKQQLGDEKEAHQKAQQQVAAQSQELISVKEENDLVIAELHRVQELLESKLIEREELVKQRDDLRNHYEIAIKQRDSALQQLEQRFTQLQQLHLELKKYQAEQKNLTSRIDRYQTQLNVQKEEFQQALQEQSTWLTWVRCNAAHYSAATYKHSRSHRKTLKQQAALVQASQHFDKQWYLEQYPDIAKSTMDPVEHYLKFGVLEARNPSPNFDTKFYITRNPDIAESGYQPLLHYIQHGQMEHRQTRLEQLQLPSPQQPSEEASNGENAQASQETR
ncbi:MULTISPECIES: hypothetical protein [unclassified Halomonas]|uniref:hypothetical protein n=1 Tax=unclassified Halomonas TaxID=2609666 RepID=UPI001CF1BEA8|nr:MULTISPECIES: hypothetical protein [unclassified Halomonas]MCA8866601.1 hypothetical protein [Halomonas sp. SBBP1]UZH11515.1 hypothetical protein OM794_07170 [Halomonas sp. BDJS001]